ncbi:VMAP-C domain-containing protein, partial [Streptomyces sp. NPDC001948]
VEKWQLPADSLPLGVQRPVVVRCSDEGPDGPDPSDDAVRDREARWNRIHTGPTRAAVLDCDDGMRVPVPVTAKLRGLPYETVPVFCRYGGRGDAQSVAGFARVLDGGFGVVLWRRPRAERAASCTEFHLRVVDTVDGAGVADRLPRKIQELRKGVCEGRPDTFWSDGIALVYGNPQPPPPGPLLQAP